MKMKKLLSMLLTLCIVLTTIGTMSIAAGAETTITENINVVQGQTYSLPATVGEQAVTWSPATVDTSKIGYRLYTGTFEDGSTVTYRVNVGEYVRKYDDLLAGFSVGCVNDNDTTGTNEVYTAGNGQLVVAKNDAPKIDVVNYDENTKALKLGPTGTINSSYIALTPAYTGEYRFNTRVKIEGITSSRTGDFLVGRWDIFASSTSKLINRVFVYATKDNYLKFNVGSTYRTSTVPIDDNGNTPWFDVSYCVYNDSTCSLSVNGVELFNKQTFTTSGASVGFYGFSPVNWDSNNVYTHATYCTDVTLDEVRYFTGDLPASVSDKAAQNDPSAQTATVTLTMSDGKTKDFTVNYTADTSTAGVKTANGTIDGFDGIIPVSYTVVGVTDETINTYIGADVTLADGSKADTSAFGRKYYKGIESETGITNYTVNTGTWGLKVSDDLSAHESATYTKKDNITQFETIKANSQDGFKLVVYSTDDENSSAVIAKDPDDNSNQVFKLSDMVYSEHLRWYVGDTFDGSFKVKMKVRMADFTKAKNQYTLRVQLMNSENKWVYRGFIVLKGAGAGSGYAATGEYGLFDYYNNGSAADYVKAGVATQSDGKYDTDWMDLEIIGNTQTKKFDTYLDGKLMHSGYGMLDSSATICDLARIDVSRRYENANDDAVAYIDDVEVYSHRVFTGELPENTQVLLGHNAAEASSSIALTLSDSSLISCPMTLEGVNAAVLGTVAAKGMIDGFDDKLNVNVKVCNYNISSIGWANGAEYVTAPVDGGSIADATFKNVGNTAQAQAIFAWYNSSHKLESAKIVDISGISKGVSKKITVGMALPEEVDGGYLKVFVLNSKNALVPLDLTHLEENVAATVPKVFLTGDSTTCNYEDYRFPEKGLGQQIDLFLNEEVQVINLARSGKTTTTIQTSGLWDALIEQAGAGDYIFISFGHNDQGEVTKADFTANLEKFISDAKSKGANVIMYTPIARRTQGIDGKAYTEFNCQNWSGYEEKYIGNMDAMKDVCQRHNVPFIDMTTISSAYLQGVKESDGDDATKRLYMCDIYYSWDSVYKNLRAWSEGDSFADATYRAGQYGMQDNTHFTQYGAGVWAQMLLNNVKAAYPNINLVNYMENLDKQITYPNGTLAQ